jgi:hypothetical protein
MRKWDSISQVQVADGTTMAQGAKENGGQSPPFELVRLRVAANGSDASFPHRRCRAPSGD